MVTAYVRDELEANRLVQKSPGEAEPFGIQYSPMIIISKKKKPGKWCLIVDLLSPMDASVNDRIDKELGSMSYNSVEE